MNLSGLKAIRLTILISYLFAIGDFKDLQQLLYKIKISQYLFELSERVELSEPKNIFIVLTETCSIASRLIDHLSNSQDIGGR